MELKTQQMQFSTPFFKRGSGGFNKAECGPNCPTSAGHTGRLLDLPVWTDTNVGGSGGCGGCSDPLHMVRCDSCGLPLKSCTCIAGIDY